MRIPTALPYLASMTTAALLLPADANAACLENTTPHEMMIWFAPDNKGEVARVPSGAKVCDENYEGTVNVAVMDTRPLSGASIKVRKNGYTKSSTAISSPSMKTIIKP